jgi:hypothetical protein
MARSSLHCSLLLALSCGTALLAQQSSPADAAYREAIAGHRAAIHRADSVGDAIAAAQARIMLAPLLKAPQARKLYAEAALIADSARSPADVRLRAHQGAMEINRASGNWRGAYEEAQHVIALAQEWSDRQAQLAAFTDSMRMARAVAERDSLSAAVAELQARMASDAGRAQARALRWRWAAAALAAGAAAALLFCSWFLLRTRSRMRRMSTELHALRAEVADLRKPRNTYRPQTELQDRSDDAGASQSPVASEATAPEAVRSVDPMVLALFRKQAPERMAALRAARAAGDHEKVMRVLHSLRPQLSALDPDGLGAWCNALRASSPAATDWDAGLDRLMAGIEKRLA